MAPVKKTTTPIKKRDATRATVFDAAMRLFRKQGYATTTMRQIADEAGLATGAAYYHFPSKEAIVLALYEHNHARLSALCEEHTKRAHTPQQKLVGVLRASTDVIAKDRAVLAPLFAQLAAPNDPISVFSPATKNVREHSAAWLMWAVEDWHIAAATRPLVASALWALHLGVLLYFVNDRSPKQKKTLVLIDDAVGLVLPLVQLAGSPLGAPLVAQLVGMLQRAGLAEFLVTGDVARN